VRCALVIGLVCRKDAVRRLEGEHYEDGGVELCFNHAELVLALRIAAGYKTRVHALAEPDTKG
jgi:hypothetical protein